MTPPFEQVSLAVHHEDLGMTWMACAIRLGPEDPWHTFVSYDDSGMWLTLGETEDVPTRIGIDPDQDRLRKLVAVYGADWVDIFEDPFEVIRIQAMALEALNSIVEAKLLATPLDELEDWRQMEMSASAGERIRTHLTGTPTEALRN